MCSPELNRLYGPKQSPTNNVNTGSILLGLNKRGMNASLGNTVYDAGTSGIAASRLAKSTPGS